MFRKTSLQWPCGTLEIYGIEGNYGDPTKGPEKDNFDKLLLSALQNFRFGVGMDRPGGLGFEWMLVYIPLRLQKLPSLTRTTSNGLLRNYLTECLHAQI